MSDTATDPSAMFELIRETIPFAKHAGCEILAIEPGRGLARLPDRPEVRNHIQSIHAGALFTLGETASGMAFIGAFGDRLATVRPVAKAGSIDYLKVARGDLVAEGHMNVDAAEALATLDRDGVVEFDVAVSIRDGDELEVATMVVRWHVRALAPSA